MDYFALPVRSCVLNFCPPNCLTWHTVETNLATSQKTFGLTTLGFSVLMARLFGQENKNPNFHNFFLDEQNNLYTFLNLRHLYQNDFLNEKLQNCIAMQLSRKRGFSLRSLCHRCWSLSTGWYVFWLLIKIFILGSLPLMIIMACDLPQHECFQYFSCEENSSKRIKSNPTQPSYSSLLSKPGTNGFR